MGFKKMLILCYSFLTMVCSVPSLFSSELHSAETDVPSPKNAAETRGIEDLAGRTVSVPSNIERFGCLLPQCYEKAFMLGQSPKVAITLKINQGWNEKIDQRFPILNFINFESARNASVEALADHKVQAVSYWQIPDKIEKLSEAGIPALVGMAANLDHVASVDAYVDYRCKEIEMYSSAFGGDALEKGRDWIKYFKEKVDFIYSRTKSLPDSARPSVYYVRGPDVLTTHGIYTYTWWHIIIAGGRPMTLKNTKEPVSHITPEQFLIWDPDFIFMGWLPSKAPFTDDPKWSQLQAVKNDKIFVDPKGFNDWDYSSEAPLLILFFAKTIHPELFPDVDMMEETMNFYRRFYAYDLEKNEAERILAHLQPSE